VINTVNWVYLFVPQELPTAPNEKSFQFFALGSLLKKVAGADPDSYRDEPTSVRQWSDGYEPDELLPAANEKASRLST